MIAFRDRGGKIVGSWLGMLTHTQASTAPMVFSTNKIKQADLINPYNSTTHYYDAVTALDPSVQDYYRVFLSHGLDHCFGGAGAYPATTFDAMRSWVEKGTSPETLAASTEADLEGKKIVSSISKDKLGMERGMPLLERDSFAFNFR